MRNIVLTNIRFLSQLIFILFQVILFCFCFTLVSYNNPDNRLYSVPKNCGSPLSPKNVSSCCFVFFFLDMLLYNANKVLF